MGKEGIGLVVLDFADMSGNIPAAELRPKHYPWVELLPARYQAARKSNQVMAFQQFFGLKKDDSNKTKIQEQLK